MERPRIYWGWDNFLARRFPGACRAEAELSAIMAALMMEPRGPPQTSSFGQAVNAGRHLGSATFCVAYG